MAYDKIWTFTQLNQLPADQTTLLNQCRSFLYFLKTNLLAIGWTVVSSSDSSTQGASDKWTSAAALTWNSSAAARSWILLASPSNIVVNQANAAAQVYLCIECVSASNSSFYNLTFYSTAPTGGTVAAIPTGGGAQSILTTGAAYINPTLTSSRFHFASTANGGWYAGITEISTSIMSTLLGFIDLADIQLFGANPHPFAIVGFSYYNLAIANMTYNVFDSVANTQGVKCFNYDGSAGIPRAMIWCNPASFVMPGSNTLWTGDINGNVLDSNIYIYNASAGKVSSIGRIPDFRATGASSLINSSVDNAVTPAFTFINQLLIPSNTTILT